LGTGLEQQLVTARDRSGAIPPDRWRRFAADTKRFVAARLDPRSHLGLGLTLRLLLFILAVWALGGLLDAVLDNETLVRIDRVVEAWFHVHATAGGLAFFNAVTQLGSPVANVLIAVVALYLWRVREWLLLWTWLAATLGGKVIEFVLKDTVHRTRPQYAAAYLNGQSYSFPSGHTMGATICYFFIAYIVATRSHVSRVVGRIAFIAAGIIVVAVAFSRLYLGVHYPSDVAGGFAAGLAWLSLCGVTRRIVHQSRAGHYERADQR
jgi:membrane-associated phospholipid phosphatase